MAEQKPIEESVSEETSPVAKPGGQLRTAREDKGLSLDELVVQTKLPRSTLEAIEADNFDMLSEPVYVRGYYRKYAKVVGLDEASVIEGYEAHVGVQKPRLEVPVLLQDESMGSSGGSGKKGLLFFFVLLLAGLVGAAWWLLRPTEATSVASRPAVINPPSVVEREPAQAEVPAPTRLSLETNFSAPPQAELEAPEPAEEESAETVAVVETPSAPEPEPGLALSFKEASWVRVEDGTGRRVLNGLIPAGEQRVIDESGPFSVFLGYAPGVEVVFQGESVDVSQYIRGNNTARFTVE